MAGKDPVHNLPRELGAPSRDILAHTDAEDASAKPASSTIERPDAVRSPVQPTRKLR